MNEDNKLIMNVFYKIVALFNSNNPLKMNGNEKYFFLKYSDVYKELDCIQDKEYLKLLDNQLINYIYKNDFLKFNVNTKDPVYFTKFIRLYVDFNKHGNYIYHNMSKFIYFTYIKGNRKIDDKLLDYLVSEYRMINNSIYKNNKFNLDEAQQFNRLMLYVLTYIYMNSDLLDKDNMLLIDTYQVMNDSDFYDEMNINGALTFKDLTEEDNIKIYYIKKAIKNVLKEKAIGRQDE